MSKKVAIIMGSDSDLPVVKDAAKELKNFGYVYLLLHNAQYQCIKIIGHHGTKT